MEQVQRELLIEYRLMHRLLFEFLTAYANADAMLSQAALHLTSLLYTQDAQIQLAKLIADGRDLIQKATDYARDMLYAQAAVPILDAVRLGRDGQVMKTRSLPLFPVVVHEERTQFFEYLTRLSHWHQKCIALLRSKDAC